MSGNVVRTPSREQVLALVLDAAAEALEPDTGLDRSQLSESTPLYGAGAVVDSLGLVRIITDVEETVSDQFGQEIDLTDERALSRERSPFRTVGTLVAHIMSVVGAQQTL